MLWVFYEKMNFKIMLLYERLSILFFLVVKFFSILWFERIFFDVFLLSVEILNMRGSIILKRKSLDWNGGFFSNQQNLLELESEVLLKGKNWTTMVCLIGEVEINGGFVEGWWGEWMDNTNTRRKRHWV